MKAYNPKFNIGDRVAYSANWLRWTGNFAGELPQLRGAVVDITPMGGRDLVTVKWDHGEQWNVLNVNLARVGSAAMSAN